MTYVSNLSFLIIVSGNVAGESHMGKKNSHTYVSGSKDSPRSVAGNGSFTCIPYILAVVQDFQNQLDLWQQRLSHVLPYQ